MQKADLFSIQAILAMISKKIKVGRKPNLYGPSESTNPGPHAVSRARNVKNAQTNVQTVQDKGLCLVTLTGVI